jgi:hypothetical protein
VTATDNPTGEIADLVEFMRAKAAANPDSPEPLMQGTFALYPTPDGGVMMVAAVPEGTMAGVHHYHMNPRLISGAAMLFGGNKMGAVKSLFRKKQKEIGQ